MTNVEEQRKKLDGDIAELQRELMYGLLMLNEDDDTEHLDKIQDRLDAKRHELATLYGRANDEVLPEEVE